VSFPSFPKVLGLPKPVPWSFEECSKATLSKHLPSQQQDSVTGLCPTQRCHTPGTQESFVLLEKRPRQCHSMQLVAMGTHRDIQVDRGGTGWRGAE